MEIKNRSFRTIDDLELIVSDRKHAVSFEIGGSYKKEDFIFSLKFNSETFKELFCHLKEASNESWDNINLREVDSFGADYSEYYDRKLDNNGYLDIKENILVIERPSLESNKLYQFNKRKMESFLYDLENKY